MVVSLNNNDGQSFSIPTMPAVNPAKDYMRALARFRWRQMRLVFEYERLMRREMRARWIETTEAILAKAKKRARMEAERVRIEEGVAIEITPTMQAKALDGTPLRRAALNVRASVNF
jgi:hypothetical protein